MANQMTQVLEKDEIKLLRDQLTPEEIFLLGFLKGFDRKVVQEWEENELWDFNFEED